jgi:hypothetical protein
MSFTRKNKRGGVPEPPYLPSVGFHKYPKTGRKSKETIAFEKKYNRQFNVVRKKMEDYTNSRNWYNWAKTGTKNTVRKFGGRVKRTKKRNTKRKHNTKK